MNEERPPGRSSENVLGDRTVSSEVRVDAEGHARVALRGHLDAESTGRCWRKLQQELGAKSISTLDLDLQGLVIEGNVAVTLVRWLAEGGMTRGAHVRVSGLSGEQANLLSAFGGQRLRVLRRRPQRGQSLIEEIGAWTRSWLRDWREQIAFLGQVPRVVPGMILHPRALRWTEVRRVFESAGVDALPVVGVFSGLVGLVLALEASHPLEQFGAQLYIADMLGFATVRDTGPLVTAIMLAGRSSSAFAAELGTMKINQELDALKTMGLNPVRFLVVQRMLAMLLVTPMLTLYAMAVGLMGGVLVMRFLGFPPLMIFQQIIARLRTSDLAVGLVKSILFGLIIGGVGCLRGLQTKQGASAVGVSTTRSVVSSILLVILGDTMISAVLHFLKL
jgi:phospholipid/cholesterol/gamma-HCH transport system permease protein